MAAGVVDDVQLRPPVRVNDILAASLAGRKISTWVRAWVEVGGGGVVVPVRQCSEGQNM